jgi:hypothetical protein
MNITKGEAARRLSVGRVPDRELVWAISNVIGSAHLSGGLRMDFPTADDPALSLVFRRRGGLYEVIPGLRLTEEVFSRIEREVNSKLLPPQTPAVHRIPLFAHVPTEGYWRYRDKLAVRRAPDEAPRSHIVTSHQPLILEVAFDGSDDLQLRNMRAQNETRKFSLLLSLLVPGIRVPPANVSHHWMLDTTPGKIRSVYAQESYFIPNFEGYASELSPQGELPGITLVDSMPRGIGDCQVLVLPHDLERKLDVFLSLGDYDRDRLLRAAYWLHHAREVWNASKSASFQSTIQAVEALLDDPARREKCKECGALHPGPTTLFRQFIDRYAPTREGEDGSSRKLLYDKRSQLTHGSSLMATDEMAGLGWLSPTPSYEWRLTDEAQRVCRRAIIEWLDTQG